MHRQAMLVSLSLSPASAAAVTHNKHWAFLEEIDAPRWVDLTVEAALVGTVGDDPWFYRSHPHHEVPLKELNGVQPENGKKDCSKKSGRLQIERKKSSISKKQQALETFNVFPENVASESEAERPVVVKVASHGQLWARNQVRCAQPQSFEHHHDMDVARLFMEEACAPALESESLINDEDAKELPPLSLDISPVFCKSADRLLESKQIPSLSPSAFGGAARSVVSQLEGQQVELPRLNDGRRLRKSLGSAMRVKLDDGLNSSVAAGCGVVPLPRSGSTGGDGGFGTTAVAKAIRLGLGTRVDINKGKTREVGCVETESDLELCGLGPDLVLNADKIRIRAGLLVEEPERMGSETNPSSLEQSCSMNGNSGTRDNLESRSFCDGGALSTRLGVNSSVHAFDDIRRMRKSWGSALRVKISEDLEAVASEVGSNIESGTNKIKSSDVILGSLSSLSEESSSGAPPVEIKKEKNAVVDSQGPSQDEVVHMKPEVARVLKGLLAGACTQTATVKSIFGSCEGQPSKRIREKPSTNGFPSTPIIVVSANARRSMSLGYLEKGTDSKMKSSNCSGSVQQNHPVRASSVCQPAEILSRVRSSKVGKENSTVQSPSKSKVNTGLVLENKTQQSVLRMSMPSFAAGAVSRQAVGAGLSNKSNTILERSGEVQVPVSSQLGSRKSCVSNQRKSVGHHKSPSKRMPVMDASSRTQQSNGPSAMRASVPTFSSAILKQTSKSVHNAGVSSIHDGKKSSKHGDNNDIAALIAEHNRKFRPIPKYEPRLHSVKAIREWERITGQLYYNLQPAEREKVNDEISALKHMQ